MCYRPQHNAVADRGVFIAETPRSAPRKIPRHAAAIDVRFREARGLPSEPSWDMRIPTLEAPIAHASLHTASFCCLAAVLGQTNYWEAHPLRCDSSYFQGQKAWACLVWPKRLAAFPRTSMRGYKFSFSCKGRTGRKKGAGSLRKQRHGNH